VRILAGQQQDIELYLQNYAGSPYVVIGELVVVKSGRINACTEFNKAVHLQKLKRQYCSLLR